MNIEEKVSKGIAFLDELRPNWRKEVNKDAIIMASCERCILGLLFGHYTMGRKDLGISQEKAIDLGFEITYGELYSSLTLEWKRRLT
jgi:tRNA U34 5-methylaminomethyl-2-thiouridine-forming methyltransferase MnmC